MVITTKIKQIVDQELAKWPKQSFLYMNDHEARDYFVGRATNDALLSFSVNVHYPDLYKTPSDMVDEIISETKTNILRAIRTWNKNLS